MNKLKPVFLASLIVIAALTSIAFSLNPARHVDPEEIPEESLLPEALLTFYLTVVDLSILERYNEALEELNKASSFYMPEDLNFTISKFHDLLTDVADKLDLVQSHIKKAEALIIVGELQEAKGDLKEASTRLSEAEDAISDLESSARQLAEALRTPAKLLLDKLTELKALANRYAESIKNLFAMIEEMTPGAGKPSVETEITIESNASEAWLGQLLVVNGSLSALGKGLPFKTVRVYLNGSEAGRAPTDENGKYLIELRIPYLYKPSAILSTVFRPSESDKETYSPCVSNPLTLKLLYYEPTLSIQPLQKALPGRNLTICGSLSSIEEPVRGHQVWLRAFAESESTFTDEAGNFKFDVSVPSYLLGGSWLAIVEAPPSGRTAPASASITIEVERIRAKIEVEGPDLALGGSKITLKGRIYLEEETSENLTVVAKLGEWVTSTRRVGSGSFSIEVYIPLGALAGNYTYSVSTASDQPWLSSATTKGAILIISPLVLGMPILAASLATVTITKAVPRRKEQEAEKPPKTIILEAPPQLAISEGLAALYWSAVDMVSMETNVKMTDNDTVREYVRSVAERLKEGLASFERLSFAYERILYARWISLKEENEAKLAFRELERVYGRRRPLTMREVKEKTSIFCIYCGRELLLDARYCDRCGRSVKGGR